MTALEDILTQAAAAASAEADQIAAAQVNWRAAQADNLNLTAELAAAKAALAQVQQALVDTAKPLPTLFGVDGERLDVTGFPRVGYCREYTRPGAGLKPLAAPASVALPHPSFHDTPTPALLNPWLDKINRAVVLEHGHEPEGDTTTAIYRGNVQALLDIVTAHPNGHFVTVAQTFTRYAQVHGNKTMTDGKPATWQNLWVKGTGLIGFDCEVDTSIKGYPDPAVFFAPAVAASKSLGVPFLIPELGWPQQASDTDGTGLAAWYVACAAYLRSQNCRGVAAFNVKGTTGDYRLNGPAKTAWQTVVASQ